MVKKNKHTVYLTDQKPGELRELSHFLVDRISEMEMDEDMREETLLPLVRGLVSFIKEEHLEEDDEDDDKAIVGFTEDEEDYPEESDEDSIDELEF